MPGKTLTPYAEKASRLVWLTDAEHVPPRIKEAVVSLGQHPTKLFCWVPEGDLAIGTPRVDPGLYASDFLCELVSAIEALDWPKVTILVHGALADDELCWSTS